MNKGMEINSQNIDKVIKAIKKIQGKPIKFPPLTKKELKEFREWYSVYGIYLNRT